MSAIILIPNDNGGVAIIHPVWDNRLHVEATPATIPPTYRPETDQELLERLRSGLPPGTPYIIADTSDLPSDRSDRDLWRVDFTGAPVA